MNKINNRLLFISALLLALLLHAAPIPTFASPDTAKFFGKGQPLQLEDLPPGRAKTRLDQLPPAARQQALRWLQRLSFPEADLEFLRFDNEGGVLYADTHNIELAADEGAAASPGVSGIQPADTFQLHSKPGASKVLFLDFDGHTISGTAWNSGRPDPLYARAFDIDGSPSTFSSEELNRIQEVWHRTAEDFSPFDIDVTTEDPGVFDATTGRVLITHTLDTNNNLMPYDTAGGVAYVGVFGASYFQSYQPAFVYYNNLGGGNPTYIAEATSHEFGHNLGLSHDGRGEPHNDGYYLGHGTGFVSWAPIMGVGYYTNVTQWSMGGYTASNNSEDDLSMIAAKLGYRTDDHSNSTSNATPLVIETDGTIISSNPETENYQLPSSDNKGVVESASDVDYFSIDVAAGPLNISIKPAWAAFYRTTRRGANLDISATLYNLAGQAIISSDPVDNTNASIATTVTTGSYYLAISGVGSVLSPYPDYGSVGQYFISGTVTPQSIPVASTDLSASAASHTQINLSWSDNASNETGYRVERSLDQSSWSSLAAIAANSSSYSDSNLSPSTTYYYRVVAYNSSGDATSNVASATTLIPPPVTPSSLSANAASHTQINLSWSDNASNETGYRVERSLDQSSWSLRATIATNSTRYNDNSLAASTTYFYRVVAYNSSGDATSNVASATTLIPPPVTPSGLSANAASHTQINLSWSDNASNEDGYLILRSQDQLNWTSIAILAMNSSQYVDSGLADTSTYFYRVVAYNSSGNNTSNVASATTLIPPPATPNDLTATAASHTQINLSWNDNANNETGYRVERSLNQVNWQQAISLPENSSAHSDNDLTAATTYFYRIVNFNSSGESISKTTSATTLNTPIMSTEPSNNNGGGGGASFYLLMILAICAFSWRGTNGHQRRLNQQPPTKQRI